MSRSIYRINALIGVADPALDRAPLVDRHGRTLRHAIRGVRFVQPGEPVELDDKDGEFYMSRHGGSVEPKPVKKVAEKAPEKAADKVEDKSEAEKPAKK